MIAHLLASITLGATTALYQVDPNSGQVGLQLCPTSMVSEIVPRQEILNTPEVLALPASWRPTARFKIDSLVQLKCVGDSYPADFAQGRTMRNSGSTLGLRYDKQEVVKEGDLTTIITTLKSPRGYVCEHRLMWREGDPALTVRTIIHNKSEKPITLEMLSSFSLGGITPFDPKDAPGRLVMHRFRAGWSAEGRLDTQSFEQLQLEPAWINHNASSERFGQVGSMPVNGYFPFVAVEDTKAKVLWGAQLAWPGSWQMEVYRLDDCAAISGGLADRELGHWTKTVSPGESFEGPLAIVATTVGGLDDLCDKLTAMQERAADTQPAVEADLPIVFNEWCTTWGTPSHENLLAIADRLKGTPTKYLVIDAGWFAPEKGPWGGSQGDWIPSKKLFPDGIAATAAAIRERGLIPGLWFEMETSCRDSKAFQMVGHQLKRDGIPVEVGGRRFWDMRDPFVVDYLDRKVVGLLRDSGFGYVKVDYNETIGIGADGTESLGETLRQHIVAMQDYFRRMRRELPELVIENCASGGHRLEPSMMGLTSMASFSDAHESPEIPIIAANLHRLILPRQSQIWAVLHRTDSARRIGYSLAATFLGRMCLSGEAALLDAVQWAQVVRAQELYVQVAPIIKHGTSRRYGPEVESWRHPKGWQAILRTSTRGDEALVVAHSFAAAPQMIEIPLHSDREWVLSDSLVSQGGKVSIIDHKLVWSPEGDFDSLVLRIKTAPRK